MRHFTLFAVAFLLVTASRAAAADKAPIPDTDSQAKALAVIRDVNKAEYADRRAANLILLAGKFFQQGHEEANDLANKYVLYREAKDLAVEAGDPNAALQIIDEMDKSFVINRLDVKTKMLEAAALTAKLSSAHRLIIESCLDVLEDAFAADDFETAAKLIKLGQGSLVKVNSRSLPAALESRSKELEAMKKDFEQVKKANETLTQKPEDPEANLIVGKYLIYRKGDFEKGVPRLALCSDAKLKDAAKKEGAAAGDGKVMEAADAWYDLGQAETGRARAILWRQALTWYQQAASNKLTGLDASKVKKRIADLEAAPQVTKFFLVPIDNVCTASSTGHLFDNGDSRIHFPNWGAQKYNNVPFNVIDPGKEGNVRNAILLYCDRENVTRLYPPAIKIPCECQAKAIHILGGISAWGYPWTREPTVPIVMRLVYQNNTSEDIPLVNGIHFADWVDHNAGQVPGSMRLWIHGRAQMRYMVIRPKDSSTPLKAIELLKGPRDRTCPVFFAFTVEKPNY